VHRRFFLLGLLFLSLSFSLSAQSVRDSVTIEVVDVPVFVTRSGEPVEGLTRDDFELFVNGKRQPIEYFDVVRAGGQESLRERRLFLLMIDIAFSNPHAVGRAQRAAAELIARAPKDDLFAVATFSSRRGVWFTTPFTSDRLALSRGVASLSVTTSGDPLGVVLTSSERSELSDWLADAPERSEQAPEFGLGSFIDKLTADSIQDVQLAPAWRKVEHQLLDFRDLADRLAALQGQKHMVVLSEGRGLPGSLGSTTFRHLDDMQKAFQRADILLHTLDLRGVARMPGNSRLHVLSEGTGGEFVHSRNDFAAALVDLVDNYRHGYVLGFRPVAKRGHNTIEVKLRNAARNTTVRHRRGFTGTPQKLNVNEGLYLADVVLNDVPQTGTAAALELEGGQLQVSVPLRPLAAQLGTGGTAQLYVYVFGENGVPLDFHRRVIDVPADASGDQTFTIDVPDHAQVAKALLVVDESLGFSRTE
jgi:VWFA-related protein